MGPSSGGHLSRDASATRSQIDVDLGSPFFAMLLPVAMNRHCATKMRMHR